MKDDRDQIQRDFRAPTVAQWAGWSPLRRDEFAQHVTTHKFLQPLLPYDVKPLVMEWHTARGKRLEEARAEAYRRDRSWSRDAVRERVPTRGKRAPDPRSLPVDRRRELVEMRAAGYTLRSLATRFGVSVRTVGNIVRDGS